MYLAESGALVVELGRSELVELLQVLDASLQGGLAGRHDVQRCLRGRKLQQHARQAVRR